LNTYIVFMPLDLRTELKQTKPFRSLRQEASLSIQRTAAVLEHAFETWLKPSGITATQYNVLRILRGAGSAGLCRTEIGERMVRRVPDVTRLLDRLEEQGLIERVRGGSDRRYVTTTITKAGLDVLSDLDRAVDEFHQQEFGHMDEATLKSLVDLLAAVREGE
jgi:MarR family transcriptional regulator, organic hydroperoxide resistance regulator